MHTSGISWPTATEAYHIHLHRFECLALIVSQSSPTSMMAGIASSTTAVFVAVAQSKLVVMSMVLMPVL
eukprot:scaffold192412_cov38-Prasinocladus_malaysianus.AAC.1